MSNLEKYNNAFNSTFNIKVEEMNEVIDNNSVSGWDSISQLRLVTAIEDEFSIMLETEDILDFKSYLGGKEILKKYDIIL
jgi:acyl carrier protein